MLVGRAGVDAGQPAHEDRLARRGRFRVHLVAHRVPALLARYPPVGCASPAPGWRCSRLTLRRRPAKGWRVWSYSDWELGGVAIGAVSSYGSVQRPHVERAPGARTSISAAWWRSVRNAMPRRTPPYGPPGHHPAGRRHFTFEVIPAADKWVIRASAAPGREVPRGVNTPSGHWWPSLDISCPDGRIVPRTVQQLSDFPKTLKWLISCSDACGSK